MKWRNGGLGFWALNSICPTGNSLWWRSYRFRLSQGIALPHSQQVQTLHPRLLSLLRPLSLFHTKSSYPWKGVDTSILPALLAGGPYWISWSWIWAPFLGQGCFLNKQKTKGEKCQSFTCAYIPGRTSLWQNPSPRRNTHDRAWLLERSVFHPISRDMFLGGIP